MSLHRQLTGRNMRVFARIQSIHLEFLKKIGYEIISYVHKSPSEIDPETRLRLLQKMVNNLLDRSLIDKVYVSVSNRASSPFNERDLNTTDEIMGKLKYVTRNTPDMSEYFQSVDHNSCLASIDFAGISSRSHLVKDLLEEYPVIKLLMKLLLMITQFFFWTLNFCCQIINYLEILTVEKSREFH